MVKSARRASVPGALCKIAHLGDLKGRQCARGADLGAQSSFVVVVCAVFFLPQKYALQLCWVYTLL